MSTAHLQGLESLQLGYQVVTVQLHVVEIMLLLLNLPGLASLQSVHFRTWYIEHTTIWQTQMLLLHPHPLQPENDNKVCCMVASTHRFKAEALYEHTM